MKKQDFPLEHILYCVALACKQRGGTLRYPTDILKFLAGETPGGVVGHSVSAVLCGLALLRQYPQLAREVTDLGAFKGGGDAFKSDNELIAWVKIREAKYGATLSVEAIPDGTRQKLLAQARVIVDELIPPETYADMPD